MYKVTNKSTTYLAIGNANVAPGESTESTTITQALQFLREKRAIKIDWVHDKPVKAVIISQFKASKEKK